MRLKRTEVPISRSSAGGRALVGMADVVRGRVVEHDGCVDLTVADPDSWLSRGELVTPVPE